uniref:Uncharacterized protein n=1 Tax=Anopheles funestus TaxID=62324 RepID=A0A182RY44_ANOFN
MGGCCKSCVTRIPYADTDRDGHVPYRSRSVLRYHVPWHLAGHHHARSSVSSAATLDRGGSDHLRRDRCHDGCARANDLVCGLPGNGCPPAIRCTVRGAHVSVVGISCAVFMAISYVLKHCVDPDPLLSVPSLRLCYRVLEHVRQHERADTSGLYRSDAVLLYVSPPV